MKYDKLNLAQRKALLESRLAQLEKTHFELDVQWAEVNGLEPHEIDPGVAEEAAVNLQRQLTEVASRIKTIRGMLGNYGKEEEEG